MFNYQKFTLSILIGLTTVLLNVGYVLPVEAMTQQLQMKGDRGYQVQTIFSYDEAQPSTAIHQQRLEPHVAIAEQDTGTTNTVNYLKVSFYNPSGSMMASYDNIVDGIAYGNYFEFHYDPLQQKLWGEIDLGGESAGEMYLKGNVAEQLSLIMVEASGKEKVIDQLSVVSH